MDNQHKCPTCGGNTCPACGKAQPVCSAHCYCQTLYVGGIAHYVCCKCGDRNAVAYTPWPSYPYWSIIPPAPSSIPTFGTYETNGTGDFPTGSYTFSKMASDSEFARLSNEGADQIADGRFVNVAGVMQRIG